MNDQPIGFFDSGSGGLTIWTAVHTLLPHESTVYIGDHGFMPYSDKTVPYIRERGERCISFLIQQHCKVIVVACNTATVAGIDYFRQVFPTIPIVGVVPVVKTAANQTQTHCFGICSTEYTAKSAYMKQLIGTYAPHDTVYRMSSTHLVSYIEAPDTAQNAIDDEIVRMLKPSLGTTMDILVLGCTHFPFIKERLQHILGDTVIILDSGPAVARQVERIIKQNSIERGDTTMTSRTDVFFTTGNASVVSKTVSHLMNKTIVVQQMEIA